MEVKKEVKPTSWQEVKHFVLDNTNGSKKAIVHFNFRERSELTPTLTPCYNS